MQIKAGQDCAISSCLINFGPELTHFGVNGLGLWIDLIDLTFVNKKEILVNDMSSSPDQLTQFTHILCTSKTAKYCFGMKAVDNRFTIVSSACNNVETLALIHMSYIVWKNQLNNCSSCYPQANSRLDLGYYVQYFFLDSLSLAIDRWWTCWQSEAMCLVHLRILGLRLAWRNLDNKPWPPHFRLCKGWHS